MRIQSNWGNTCLTNDRQPLDASSAIGAADVIRPAVNTTRFGATSISGKSSVTIANHVSQAAWHWARPNAS